jgi:beta-N-acetylhexosaminidase
VDGPLLAEQLNEASLPGILAHPRTLELGAANGEGALRPGPEAAPPCPGVFLEVVDPKAYRPVTTGLRLLSLLRTLWPEDFSWRRYPTAANPTGEDHLRLLVGSEAVAKGLEDDPALITGELLTQWTHPTGWWARAQPHLLYP